MASETGIRPIGVGVIGLGNSGRYYHAEGTLFPSPHYRLAAVCDTDETQAHAAAERFGATAYTDWRKLAADDTVELVVVALPHHLHRDVCVGCSAAGNHVVVEKPMATTTADALAMITAAEQAGRLLTVFHQRRWDPDFRVIREAVRAGAIGAPWRAETRRSNAGAYVVAGAGAPHAGTEVAEWAHARSGGGGVVFLAAPHLVDHLLQLIGRLPRTVSARTHTENGDAKNGDAETYVEITMDFGDGLVCRAEVSPSAPTNPAKWAVYGRTGAITSATGRTVVARTPDGERTLAADLPPLRHCDEFYEILAAAIRKGTPPPVYPRDGLAVIAVLEAALESAAAGATPVPFSLPT